MIKLHNFNKGMDDEFACKCGACDKGIAHMQDDLLARIDNARTLAGVPFVLNRGISCEAHNKRVGGSVTSSHLTGWAVDIDCNDGCTRFQMVKGLMDAGFKRIGIYKDAKGTFIHADRDPDKPEGVIW